MPPAVPERMVRGSPSMQQSQLPPMMPSPVSSEHGEDPSECFDSECMKFMNEYFYGVRIFPGQDPSHVFVGWVTTQYHYHSSSFSNESVRKVIVAPDEFDDCVEG